MLSKTIKNEIEYISIARGIAIALVVAGHANLNHSVHSFVSLFHLAVFFFISGYLYKEKYKNNLLLLIKRRLRSLYVPFLFYQILFLFFHNIFFKYNILSEEIGLGPNGYYPYSVSEYILKLIMIITFSNEEPLVGSFWFIPLIFQVNIIFGAIGFAIEKTVERKSEYIRAVCVATVCAIGFILLYYRLFLPRGMNKAFIALVLFYFGHLFARNESSVNVRSPVIACICFVFLLVNSYLEGFNFNSPLITPSPYFFNSFIGIYLVIFLSKKSLQFEYPRKILKYLGNNTLFILAFHELFFKIVHVIQIQLYDLPGCMLGKRPVIDGSGIWWIAYFSSGLLLPLAIKYCFEKVWTCFSAYTKKW